MINCGIDIGSNTMRLLIAEVVDGKVIKTLSSLRNITRLGATDKLNGTSHSSADATYSHFLSQESLDKSIAALIEYKAEMDKYTFDNVVSVATDAIRRAANKDILLNAAKEIGIEINVISGEQEAMYTMQGVLSGLNKTYPSLLIYDVGGGSTEIIYTHGSILRFSVSIPLGVVTVADKFGFINPTTVATHKKASEFIASMLKPAKDTLLYHSKQVNAPITLIGTAGAVTSLAALHLRMKIYNSDFSDKHILTQDHLLEIEKSLMGLNLNDKLKIPGVDAGRDDLYIPGALILNELFKIVSLHNDLYNIKTESLVSPLGMREGLIIAPIS